MDDELNRRVREQLLKRYARMWPSGRHSGKPMFCTPKRGGSQHSKGKAIFDTAEQAKAFAAEVRRLCGDKTPTWVYACDRSRHGHVHLTTEKKYGQS